MFDLDRPSDPRQKLWQEVLLRAVEDAILGPGLHGDRDHARRIALCEEARRYITTPSEDLTTVCTLSGIDPEAVIDAMKARLATAPSPQELAAGTRKSRSSQGARPDAPAKRKAATYTFDGEALTIRQWADKMGMPVGRLSSRLGTGWSIEEALTASVGQGRARAIAAGRSVSDRHFRSSASQVLYLHDGHSLTLAGWAERTGISVHTLASRLRAGWSIEDMLTAKAEPKTITHDGKTLTVRQWAELTGIKAQTIEKRLRTGKSIEEALSAGDRRKSVA